MGEWKRNLLKKSYGYKANCSLLLFWFIHTIYGLFGLYNLCQKLLPMFLCSNANFQNESLMKLQFGHFKRVLRKEKHKNNWVEFGSFSRQWLEWTICNYYNI